MELLVICIPLCTSYWYFKSSPATAPMAQRLLVSAHGISALALLFIAMTFGFSGNTSERLHEIFLRLQAMPLMLILLALLLFRGPRSTHWLQVLNVPATLVCAFISLMAVSGRWI